MVDMEGVGWGNSIILGSSIASEKIDLYIAARVAAARGGQTFSGPKLKPCVSFFGRLAFQLDRWPKAFS